MDASLLWHLIQQVLQMKKKLIGWKHEWWLCSWSTNQTASISSVCKIGFRVHGPHGIQNHSKELLNIFAGVKNLLSATCPIESTFNFKPSNALWCPSSGLGFDAGSFSVFWITFFHVIRPEIANLSDWISYLRKSSLHAELGTGGLRSQVSAKSTKHC